uniref:Uncharacterized protein AlNc14C19G1987 n=1 Tax=Albugo laibachii Nc14 TaxID=890382 RepID=F0W516_9STRA|nr:conserved hypothetical protein [Albugo laibachii Nc14]|eukprot:CCA16207.1 conserved hypothetical protein [Albugo laibachii Nc14]
MFSIEPASTKKQDPFWNDAFRFLDDAHDEALLSALYFLDESTDATGSSLIPSLNDVFPEYEISNLSNDVPTTTTSNHGADKTSNIIRTTTNAASVDMLQQPIHDAFHPNTTVQPPSHDQDHHFENPHYTPYSEKQSNLKISKPQTFLELPVDVLTQNGKKLRRRAQVAKSAQKHRSRQKEELNRLRKEVCRLQDEMLAMEISYTSVPTTAKRKGIIDSDLVERDASYVLTENVPRIPISNTNEVGHWSHHLPANPELRATVVRNLMRRHTDLAMYQIETEFGSHPIHPQFDVKINVNNPNVALKAVRTTIIDKFDYKLVSEASWQSACDFKLPIPHWLKSSMTIEKLEDFDENTRYGRLVMPLFRRFDTDEVVFLHSYLLMHRVQMSDRTFFVWDSVDSDELYPFNLSSTNYLNLEVGCATYYNDHTNGKLRTVLQGVVRSKPPVGLDSEPNCRLTECILSFFVRRSDLFDNATRLRLIQTLVAHEKPTEDTEKDLIDIKPPDAFSREFQ